MIERGGLSLKTGKIGRTNVIRQQIMMPGERMKINLNGQVKMETLRERDALRMNAHLGIFMTPLRWLWPDYPNYVKQGPDTAISAPESLNDDWGSLGMGASAGLEANIHDYFRDAPLRIYNEWYKFPEDADATAWESDGLKAVPLSRAWSRARYTRDPDDTNDYQVSSLSNFDVRELAEKQARFRAAEKRDITSFNRWMELVEQTWGMKGSREVDQVPMLIDSCECGVNPRDMPATDSAGLGQWQSMFDFQVNHRVNGDVIAPEHCILTYILTVRFGSITEGRSPLGNPTNWFTQVADPEYFNAARPTQVTANQVFATTSATLLGYLPAGWEWRTEHDVIGKRIDELDSFPYMNIPTTQAEAKDATRIKNAFRSARLGDYVTDIRISEQSVQPIGPTQNSYFSGMAGQTKNVGKSDAKYPFGGKQL